MSPREKRSISLPADLFAEISRAAESVGTTISGWLAETAAHRLKIEAGLAGVEAWKAQHGPITDEERERADAWVREALGQTVEDDAEQASA